MTKSMSENSREIILDMLLSLERGESYSNKLIAAVLEKYNYLNRQEKAFIKRVTEGTLERKIELDYYLEQFSTVPVRKMKPLIRCLLRMSVYQLLFMDTIPDSAVCNEAVKLATKRKFAALKGFVNGLLRNIARNKDQLKLPDEKEQPLLYLSVKYSMPEWIVQMWLDEYGPRITKTILEGLMEIRPVSVSFPYTVSPQEREQILAKMKESGAQCNAHEWLAHICLLEKVAGVSNLPGYEEGKFIVQDISSALAVEAAQVKDTDFVVDVCAAPGGKSLMAASKAKRVLSRDLTDEKVSLIEENLQRMGFSNVETAVCDARVWTPELESRADVVLLDAPCSGLGIIGKKRDIKYHATPEGLKSLAELQKEIVKTVAAYVRPGGTLIYSTCTINTAENEEMVRFITENTDLEPTSLEGVLPDAVLEAKNVLNAQRQKDGKEGSVSLSEAQRAACIQILPGFMKADGFFIARFKRKDTQ